MKKRVKKLLVLGVVTTMFISSTLSVSAAGLKELFSAKYYADTYPDLKAAFGYDEKALYRHFITYGLAENRNMNPVIDIQAYRAAYPDLDAAFGDNWDAYVNHFLTYGAKEGREQGVLFNPLKYAAAYSDIAAAFGTDIQAITNHYLTHGITEGRTAGTAAAERSSASESTSAPESSNNTDSSSSSSSSSGTDSSSSSGSGTGTDSSIETSADNAWTNVSANKITANISFPSSSDLSGTCIADAEGFVVFAICDDGKGDPVDICIGEMNGNTPVHPDDIGESRNTYRINVGFTDSSITGSKGILSGKIATLQSSGSGGSQSTAPGEDGPLTAVLIYKNVTIDADDNITSLGAPTVVEIPREADSFCSDPLNVGATMVTVNDITPAQGKTGYWYAVAIPCETDITGDIFWLRTNND